MPKRPFDRGSRPENQLDGPAAHYEGDSKRYTQQNVEIQAELAERALTCLALQASCMACWFVIPQVVCGDAAA